MLALTALFFCYGKLLVPHLPPELALPVLVAVLVLSGVVVYVASRRAPWLIAWLLIAAIIIPLPSLLYFGGDPAKPGLENLIYIGMVVVILVAELLAWLSNWVFLRVRSINAEA
jgi:hypothetical protein